ncbi:TetR/AcrR family transcriptional regulator [Rhodococcus aerolatus]
MRVTRPTAAERRAQVVEATIAVVAEDGYRAATFANITRRAGLSSTRMISYHFADKDELVAEVVATLFRTISTWVEAHGPSDVDGPREALLGYVRSTVELHDAHRLPMRALSRIFLDHRPSDGSRPYGDPEEDTAVTRVERILTDGCRTGVFRAFDPWVMAVTVQRSLDGIAFLLETAPDLDLGHYADELVTTVDRATRP